MTIQFPSPIKSESATNKQLRMAVSCLASMREALLLADTSRRFIWMTREAEALFGYKLGELRGQQTKVLYHRPDDFRKQGKERYNNRSSGTAASYNMKYRCKNGRVFVSETIGWALHNEDGEVIGYAALVRDLTDKVQLSNAVDRLHGISSDRSLSSAERIDAILRLGSEQLKMPTGIVSMIRNDRYTVLFGHSTVCEVSPGTEMDLYSTFCERAFRADAPLAIHQVSRSAFAHHPRYQDSSLQSYLGVTLTVDGTRVGTLNFSSPVPHAEFTEADIDLIRLYAAWIGQELGMEQANERLALESTTDWLTKAVAVRLFRSDVEDAYDAFVEDGVSSSMIKFSVDHLKTVNDQFGYAMGDEVLCRVVAATADLLPPGAQVYRLSGSVFATILRGNTKRGADKLAQRIDNCLKELGFDADGDTFQITASFGVATLGVGMKRFEDWLNHADSELLHARQEGRDRPPPAIRAKNVSVALH